MEGPEDWLNLTENTSQVKGVNASRLLVNAFGWMKNASQQSKQKLLMMKKLTITL